MAKHYKIKEIFYTLQGEGVHAGRPAVFCRFTGCNLWTGRESDRQKAICQFCDTDFVGTDGENGGVYEAKALVARIVSLWPDASRPIFTVCTGGEPMLQMDLGLIQAMQTAGIYIALETNGTIPVPSEVDWICVSPKQGAELVQRSGDELKVVIPQDAQPLEEFASMAFKHFLIQPMDGPHLKEYTALALQYCLQHPTWKLSLQTHKILEIP